MFEKHHFSSKGFFSHNFSLCGVWFPFVHNCKDVLIIPRLIFIPKLDGIQLKCVDCYIFNIDIIIMWSRLRFHSNFLWTVRKNIPLLLNMFFDMMINVAKIESVSFVRILHEVVFKLCNSDFIFVIHKLEIWQRERCPNAKP